VTFDGVAAPINYVSDSVVAVQVPAGLTTGGSTQIQVTSSSGSSSTIPLIASTANPGVFTYEAGGGGQAKGYNQDGSANGDGSIFGTDKPAAAGSIISVYATGLGAVTPAVAAGTPTPTTPLSSTVSPVTAYIAGHAAVVTFAGLAPGTIGVYQVNIIVPLTAPSGTDRLVLYVNGIGSQTGASIQVK
jgi:adhesin/invasin